jgi:hypothetical protein
MRVIVTAVGVLRNLTRFTLPQNDPAAPSVARSVCTAITRFAKPSEPYPSNSALVLFHTLSDDGTDLPRIFADFPVATYRAGDPLSAFASIRDGKPYLPPCEYDGRVIGLVWVPSDRDTTLAEQTLDLISANPQKSSVSQKQLTCFFPRMANVNPEFLPAN